MIRWQQLNIAQEEQEGTGEVKSTPGLKAVKPMEMGRTVVRLFSKF